MQDTRRAVLTAVDNGPVSGGDLADRLGITRAAIWKHVERLRDDGFEIEAGDDGYELEALPEFGAAAVALGLDAPYEVEFHDSIASTNDRARELAAEGREDVVVLADEQIGGRGRLDRAWRSPSGGVWLSILLRPARPAASAPLFTLAAAVATARAAREASVDAGIKWPNDVVVGERKLAGVLTEMEGEAARIAWLVVGVGVNANVDPAELDGADAPTSLSAERDNPVDRRRFTQRLLEVFDALRGDPDAVLPAWRDLAATLGQRVRVETPTDVVEGTAVDVTDTGALLVEASDGTRTLTAGDCEHLRPS
jgi:BirA family biotin operon repressor/biotin-[acetyl-CoA-carboxylase] ligase